MNFKIVLSALLGVLMGIGLIVVTFDTVEPVIRSTSKSAAQVFAKPVKKLIDMEPKRQYPVGTFEHEHKKTI